MRTAQETEVRSFLTTSLVTEKDVRVRESIVRYWSHCYQGAGSRAPGDVYNAMLQVATSDPSPNLRMQASEILRFTAGFQSR
jgi:hypothetical protein